MNEIVVIDALKFAMELSAFSFPQYPFFAYVSQLCIRWKIIPT